MTKNIEISDQLAEYCLSHSNGSDLGPIAELPRLTREEFPKLGSMQIDPLQGPLLGMIARLIDAKRVIEVGTFTGLSSLWLASAIGSDGKLVCCDLSIEYTSLAQKMWEKAGYTDRIELKIGPAMETIKTLAGPFDMAFLDANKEEYPQYLIQLADLIRPGGVIVADNTLWSGRVLDTGSDDPDTIAIRGFNQLALSDDQFWTALLPVADGVSILFKVG